MQKSFSILGLQEKEMQFRKATIPTTDGSVEGLEIPIKKSTENWSEYELDDGTVIRLKATAGLCVRVDGQYDQDGNPRYYLRGNPTMMIVSVPDDLRKKDN
jgi:hypothetical protein